VLKSFFLSMKSLLFSLVTLAATALVAQAADAKKVVLMIAGKPSHGPGQHEHNAGVLLFKKCLEQAAADKLEVLHHLNGAWPSTQEMGRADTILIYSDGGGGHPALQEDRLAQLDKEMDRGCGFVCVHYAVEPTIPKGNAEFIEWMGGCFEIDWSVNPHWDANFTKLPDHPISSGVKPFTTNDEWYFHMRFRRDMQGVTPILSAVAPPETMNRPDGHHSGNPAVREVVKACTPQHVAWAVERAEGGRGFGFTGGHFHKGWANPDQRKLVLNAILWTAKVEVPATGVETKLTDEELNANQDPKPEKKKAKK
jgi:type 1 glutamine amidotransferase